MEEVETLQLIIAILTLLLAVSELFFPWFTPYQGFLDSIIKVLSKKVEEKEKVVIMPVEKHVVIDESKNQSKPHLPESWTTTESSKSE